MSQFQNVLGSLLEPRSTTIVPGAVTASRQPAPIESKTLGKDKETTGQDEAPAPPLPPLATPDLVISPAFKLVVWLVFALIVLSGAALVYMALQPTSDPLKTVMNLIGSAFTGAVGALLGLIGGKSIT